MAAGARPDAVSLLGHSEPRGSALDGAAEIRLSVRVVPSVLVTLIVVSRVLLVLVLVLSVVAVELMGSVVEVVP